MEKGEEIKDKYHDKIANYFNVDVNWLQTGEGDRTPTSSVGDSPNVNRSGENPPTGMGRNTNVNATLRNSDSTSSSRKTEGEKKMQAPDDWSGEGDTAYQDTWANPPDSIRYSFDYANPFSARPGVGSRGRYIRYDNWPICPDDELTQKRETLIREGVRVQPQPRRVQPSFRGSCCTSVSCRAMG